MFAAAHRPPPSSPGDQSPITTKQCAASSCSGAGIITWQNFRRAKPDLWSHNTQAEARLWAHLVDHR